MKNCLWTLQIACMYIANSLNTLTWTMIYVARLTPATTSTAPPSAPTWGRICTAALSALPPTTAS